MDYKAIVGFIMMILITVLLMKKKVSTIFSFTVIPLVAAIIIGSSVKQIGTYLTKGLAMTTSVALIMLFSLPYFMLMADTGLFSGIVKRIVSRVRMNPVVLAILTVIVAMITGLDVSITSVYLITVPLLLPFYKKMKMQPVILVFLTSLGIINTFDVPWSARMLRSASLIPKIDNGTNYLFAKLFPPQIVLTVVIFGIAVFLGLKETRRLKKLGIDAAAAAKAGGDDDDVFEEDAELVQPKKFWINVALTLVVIVCLFAFPDVPSYYTFALGLVIALEINFHDQKLQVKLLKKYASSLFPVMPAILLSGVVVGVMEFSGMMQSMVKFLVGIIPAGMGPWIYIIIGLVGTPLMFVFTNDTWYYVLMPIVIGLMRAYGVPADVVIVTLFMNMGAMLTPIAQPQLYIGTDLTNGEVDLPQYMKFAFIPIWLLNIVWIGIGLLMGTFR